MLTNPQMRTLIQDLDLEEQRAGENGIANTMLFILVLLKE